MVATCHISSAVVRTLPERMQAVSNAIDALPDTQVFHAEDGRIIVVMEGPDSSALGSQLSEIALIEGVLSATMVYEQVETLESLGEHYAAHPAGRT
jgi:periplasmic nitrate reductase NapD